MKELSKIIRLNPKDSVAIARHPISKGSDIGNNITTLDDIPAAHKVALMDIKKGSDVIKYGQVIGMASQDIKAGKHVHLQNLAMEMVKKDYAFSKDVKEITKPTESRTFMGIRRKNGKAATRNYIGVISTVNCSATVVKKVAQHFQNSGILAKYPNIDGVMPISHSFGCCIDIHGEGLEQLRRTIAGFVEHANFAGVVLIGLGCEANQIKP